MPHFTPNAALQALLDEHLPQLAASEGLTPACVASAIAEGTMVLLGNPAHPGLRPLLVGQPARVKVNANLGASPLAFSHETEMTKLDVAIQAGADTVMDLSTGGDLTPIRTEMLARCPVPLGTVPLYGVVQRRLGAKADMHDWTAEDLVREIRLQAEQGVDFMTLHMGVTRRGADLAQTEGARVLGIVSRGGSITAAWMRKHGVDNPLLERMDEVLDICARHNVVISLGDGLRPGAGADAGDAAQWEEVIVLGEVAKAARAKGVQVMIEGPGHVPLHQVGAQIQGIKRLCHGAPLYVLGPLVVDCSPGYDHIAGAIGGALAVQHGADFLCYVTPAEHLTLPEVDDVRQGVMASRIAAQAGEVALGRPHALARNLEISKARARLDWEGMAASALDPAIVCRRGPGAKEKVCAMCGEFCAVRLNEQLFK
ncbi:MAG: phosphomethylpyrimidine synthase ThiC [Desulfovibrio sp.]|nr:phosphomethylpyrimidine synthase ThiC [Desulfovibrio sp.]MCA1985754.1 phosphomethylpyrimidine synthase ThiC [Desulfovibrio sp.]